MNTRLLATAATACVALATAACASTTNGHGAGPTDAATSTAAGHDFPSQSPGAVTASAQASSVAPVSSSPSARPGRTPYKTVTVEGTTTGTKITGHIYASDNLTTCAGHAYGNPMIAFLRKYPCLHAHRVLSTVVVDGRTAVLSAVDASFGPIGQDPYAAAARFIKLERADNTGSVNDLLREGHAIPGIASRIPAHEVFQVVGQDNSATVLDAWYVGATTYDHDSALTSLETDVFLTPLS